jgi:copper(I)-binding protein
MSPIARQSAPVRNSARRLAKFGAISAVLAVSLAGLLAGCQRQSQASAETAAAAVIKDPIKVADGRLVLPAVAGHPASAYFKIANLTHDVVTVDGLTITGTREAEMHETVDASMTPLKRLEIDAGQSIPFSPGGRHVMAFGVDPALKPGGRVRMTLRLEHGRTVTASLAVEPASALLGPDEETAAGMTGMSGMDMHH